MAKYIHSGDFARRLCKFQAIDEHSANAVISLLYAVPAADVVEVKHGEWITRKSIHNEEFYVCSVCATATDDIWRYCPHCGAKMDGERSTQSG